MNRPRIVVVGSLNMDLVVEAGRAPRMGETVLGDRIHFIPGGKGANQAVAAARLGAQTVMIGAVGQDAFGEQLVAALQKDGVVTSAVKAVDGVPTGVASILLAEGDNSIVVVPGANSCCLPEDVDRNEPFIIQADLVLLQLESPLETVIHAAKLAKHHGKKVILNPAPAQALPMELLCNVDYITPNRTELSILTGMGAEGEQLEQAMENLLELGIENVITTLGAEGSAFMRSGERLQRVSAYKVPVVDTTGAGDAFNAGLAFAIASNRALPEAISFASKVSALAVTKLGAQAGMPTLEEVEKFSFQKV
ncbi:ribokinase [Effusibacillus lacus]|uniref:Ribokinase n=1 Tax=Effusibacillus lacus TaxID=1348429 RepID=A0A292YQG3_9BACL|nr:ribokinase [Effusibacillus lacus]TCS71102.1 ribokinase [Effusibacillus lacus]GAX90745.1 ribokinase [Effusibacillus lacus]